MSSSAVANANLHPYKLNPASS